MATTEWDVQATEFANCNCNYGCACQFNALPDNGNCDAVAGYQIHQGHFAMSSWMAFAPSPCGTSQARFTRATAPCNLSSTSAPMPTSATRW